MGYTITAKDWGRYRDTLKRISDKAAEEMQKYAQAHGFQIDEAMVDYAYSLSTKYGQAAGALASQLYDEMANYWMEVKNGGKPFNKSGNFIKPAEIADTATREEVEAALRSAANEPTSIPSRVGRMVKLAGADTTVKNAIRDHAQWAWIPNGDTCPFCLMLASQGWVNASKNVLKGNHCEHIHANCDCTFAIRFDDRTNVEGYDPEKYLAIYNKYHGDLNAIRRSQYPSIADARNAARRERYAEMTRRKIATDGHEIIDKPTYNKLTKKFVKSGGIIISGSDANEHLANRAFASYLPGANVAFIRDDATVSDVLEEMYHAEQDRKHMFGNELTHEVILRREIDAQKYLLSVTEKYNIPVEEVNVTKANLKKYEEELSMLIEGKDEKL